MQGYDYNEHAGGDQPHEDLYDAQHFQQNDQAYFELGPDEQAYLQQLELQLAATEKKIDFVRNGITSDEPENQQRENLARQANAQAEQILQKSDQGTNDVNLNSSRIQNVQGGLDQNFLDLTSKYKQLQEEMQLMKNQFSQKNRQINLLIQELKKTRGNEKKLEAHVKELETAAAKRDQKGSTNVANKNQPEKFGHQLLLQQQQGLYQKKKINSDQNTNETNDPYNFWQLNPLQEKNAEDVYQNQTDASQRTNGIALDSDDLWINAHNQRNKKSNILPRESGYLNPSSQHFENPKQPFQPSYNTTPYYQDQQLIQNQYIPASQESTLLLKQVQQLPAAKKLYQQNSLQLQALPRQFAAADAINNKIRLQPISASVDKIAQISKKKVQPIVRNQQVRETRKI